MFVENFNVEADALLGSEGIHVAANGIHLAGDVFGGAVLGAFEDHVFDEMRDTIPLRVFVARAGFYPDTDRDGANMLHLLGDHSETVGQNLAPDLPYVVNHKRSQRAHAKGEGGPSSLSIVTHCREVRLRQLHVYNQQHNSNGGFASGASWKLPNRKTVI